MGVHIQEVVGTIQRAPEHGGPPSGAHGRSEPPLPEEAIRDFLEREAELAERVRAD